MELQIRHAPNHPDIHHFSGGRYAGSAIHAVFFPFATSTAISPDGRFAIINLDSDKEPYHTLFLADRRNHVKRKVLEYNRSVDVLWNPDSSSFALTDYMGSNVSECYLYSTDLARPKIKIQNEMIVRMTPVRRPACRITTTFTGRRSVG
jgi:hypothetical protein